VVALHRPLADAAHLGVAQLAEEAPLIQVQVGVPVDAAAPVSVVFHIQLSFGY
jgi:hypothetical protein